MLCFQLQQEDEDGTEAETPKQGRNEQASY